MDIYQALFTIFAFVVVCYCLCKIYIDETTVQVSGIVVEKDDYSNIIVVRGNDDSSVTDTDHLYIKVAIGGMLFKQAKIDGYFSERCPLKGFSIIEEPLVFKKPKKTEKE